MVPKDLDGAQVKNAQFYFAKNEFQLARWTQFVSASFR